MTQENDTPTSPEVQPAHVREELDQDNVTHEGETAEPAKTDDDSSTHMGALEENVTSVMPPVSGPSDFVSEGQKKDDKTINPGDELTPG